MVYPTDTRAILAGNATVSPAFRQEALDVREQILRDREWMRAYREGRAEHIQTVKFISAVLAATVDPNKK